MDQTIARLNIAHFQRLLSEEADAARRDVLLRLLAEEEAKLAEAEKSKSQQRSC